MATVGPKVSLSSCEHNDAEGPQITKNKTNFGMTLLQQIFVKSPECIAAFGGFQLRQVLVTFGEGLVQMPLSPVVGDTLIASKNPARMIKFFLLQKCLRCPHERTKMSSRALVLMAINIICLKAVSQRRRSVLKRDIVKFR